MSYRAPSGLLVGFLLVGCGPGWHQPPSLTPGPLPARQQVQVWSNGQARQWHAVTVTEDSISGVPFTKSPSCLTCRVGLDRAAVDSVRLGDPVLGFWTGVGLVAAGSLALAMILCGPGSGCLAD